MEVSQTVFAVPAVGTAVGLGGRSALRRARESLTRGWRVIRGSP